MPDMGFAYGHVMPTKRLPRPRIQRAFVRWFSENYARFMVPIRLTKITHKGVELHFLNYTSCLSVWLLSNELNVHVEWQGIYWDTLTGIEAKPYRTPNGYKCSLCVSDEGEATYFPSREGLWRDHLFEQFLQWVNEKLSPAYWLRISCIKNKGITWAKLIMGEGELSEPDRTLLFMQQLKRLDGQPVYEGSTEGVTNWIISLKPETSCLEKARVHQGDQL